MPTAKDLLHVYGVRLQLAEHGVTHPAHHVVERWRTLVARLSELDASESIVIAAGEQSSTFHVEATGELIAVLRPTAD